MLFPGLDNVREAPLVSSFVFSDENSSSVKSHLAWFAIGMGMIFPTGNMSLIALTLALLTVVLSSSPGKIMAASR